MLFNDTIAAIATASGAGAIAVIRLSGPDAIDLISEHFKPVGPKKLSDQDSHTIHLGDIVFDQQIIDQALVSVFKTPRSYTGENVVEISCHGSTYIQQTLLNKLVATKRCRIADPGEFTKRAFLNGKMSLTTAEAVADLISSESEAAHQLAINQMRGGFTDALKDLRNQLIHMASMIELELDFSGEDVTFASRDELKSLLEKLKQSIKQLLDSFAYGNAIKQGVSVALLGAPNAGKSTLLNALLNEERAIVSDIAGTTRDTIEDRLIIDGILFRFIDTAGIRETSDQIEKLGIVRSIESAQKADIVILLLDTVSTSQKELSATISLLDKNTIDRSRTLVLFNKIDLKQNLKLQVPEGIQFMSLSAKNKIAIDDLKHELVQRVLQGKSNVSEAVVSNSRHYGALHHALQEIFELESGIAQNIPSDLFAISLRKVIHHLGEITGEVSTDDLLGSIFSNFCIGK
jgi:tRNA modification GTPase